MLPPNSLIGRSSTTHQSLGLATLLTNPGILIHRTKPCNMIGLRGLLPTGCRSGWPSSRQLLLTRPKTPSRQSGYKQLLLLQTNPMKVSVGRRLLRHRNRRLKAGEERGLALERYKEILPVPFIAVTRAVNIPLRGSLRESLNKVSLSTRI